MKYINYLIKNEYSKSTITTYKSVLQDYQSSMHDMRLIKKKIATNFKSPNTAWTHYNIILSYMKWNKDKRVESLKELKIPPIPTVYRPVFNKSYLLTKTANQNNQKNVLIRFLFETGIRVSEIYTIKDINSETLKVFGKGNKTREVFHNPETTSRLAKPTVTTKTIRKWVKEVLGEEYTPHSIRRSFATHMLTKGANPKMVMVQLGHTKIETTYRYVNISKKDNKKIYDKYL